MIIRLQAGTGIVGDISPAAPLMSAPPPTQWAAKWLFSKAKRHISDACHKTRPSPLF